MIDQVFAAILEGLPTTILTGVLLTPPAWAVGTTYSLAVLKRRIDVAKQNTNLCQKFHEALERLIDNPQNRILSEYIDCLEMDLQGRRYTSARSRIGKEVENTLHPSIRQSMLQYEKGRSYENYRKIKAGLAPVLFRSACSPFSSLPLEYRYDFARDCTQQLAWIYVFHCNEARDFIETSRILRFLPFSLRKRIYM